MPQIIIEMVPDFSKLETATDEIASSGAVSRPVIEEFKRISKAADDAAAHVAKDSKVMTGGIADLSKSVKSVSKELAAGFASGMEKGLDNVTASMKEMVQETEVLEGAQKSLKREMKELTAAIAQATLEGKNSGPEFEELVNRAGEIRDAMGDAAAQINVFASDTARLDEVISVATGVAAAFSVAQGATALFVGESEDLQEAQVKLQASMATLQGLQEIANLLQKQSAAYRAITNLQTAAATAATNLETAAQSRNIIVKTAATVAMKALNWVMKQNPAFLLVGIFTALAGALVYFSGKSKEASMSTEELNTALERQREIMNRNISTVQHQTKLQIAALKQRGATEKEIHEATMKGLEREAIEAETAATFLAGKYTASINGQKLYLNNLKEANDAREAIQKKMAATTGEEDKKLLQQQLDITNDVLNAYKVSSEKRQEIELSTANFSAEQSEKARAKAKEAHDKRIEDEKKAKEKQKEMELQRLNDIKANIERELLAAKDGTEEQMKLRVKLAEAEKNISAFSAKSSAEKELVYAQYLKTVSDLTTTFHKDQKAKALQAQIDTLTAQLANDRMGAHERETLAVELLTRQRELELSQITDNAEKRKEIEARYDNDIAAKRLEIRQAAFDAELLLEQTQGAAKKRGLEALAADEKASLQIRLAAINDIALKDSQTIAKQVDNIEALHDARLLSDADYNQKHAELQDQLSQITENAEKKRTEITKAEADKQKEADKQRVAALLDASSQVMAAFNGIAQAFAERAMQRIADQKAALEQQLEAGTITEKEHKARTARLEREEARQKTAAARREKAAALFTAGVQGAKAIIEAAPNPVMIALTAALVAAQIVAISARPIPKFGRGVRSAPRGLALVGETGPELVQGKEWQYADGPRLMMLKGGERVYNPKETREIFERVTPMADARIIQGSKAAGPGAHIDYEKLTRMFGEELAKHPRNVISLDERGFTHHVQQSGSKTRYLNKRYKFSDKG